MILNILACYAAIFFVVTTLCFIIWLLIYQFHEGAGKYQPDDTWIMVVYTVLALPVIWPFYLARKVGRWVG